MGLGVHGIGLTHASLVSWQLRLPKIARASASIYCFARLCSDCRHGEVQGSMLTPNSRRVLKCLPKENLSLRFAILSGYNVTCAQPVILSIPTHMNCCAKGLRYGPLPKLFGEPSSSISVLATIHMIPLQVRVILVVQVGSQ